jgi:hypothetical protein
VVNVDQKPIFVECEIVRIIKRESLYEIAERSVRKVGISVPQVPVEIDGLPFSGGKSCCTEGHGGKEGIVTKFVREIFDPVERDAQHHDEGNTLRAGWFYTLHLSISKHADFAQNLKITNK